MISNLKSLNEAFEKQLEIINEEDSLDDSNYTYKKKDAGYSVKRKSDDAETTTHYVSKTTDKDKSNGTDYEYNYKDLNGDVVTKKNKPSWQNFVFDKPVKKDGELKKYAKILKDVYNSGSSTKRDLLKKAKDSDYDNPTRFSNFWTAAKVQGLINVEDNVVTPGPKLRKYLKKHEIIGPKKTDDEDK